MRGFLSIRGIVGGSLAFFTIAGLVNCSANSVPGSPAQVSQNATLPSSPSVVVPAVVVYEETDRNKPSETSQSEPSTPSLPPRQDSASSTSARAEAVPRPVQRPSAPTVLPTPALPTNTVIRNADLVRMTRDGAAESDLISVLKSNRSQLDTSIAALIDLKNAGVSDRIIKALLESAKAATPALLTNADVVRMTRSGQTDAAVIAAIRSSKAEFDVSTSGLVALKKEGVSDAVIEAVLAAMKKPG